MTTGLLLPSFAVYAHHGGDPYIRACDLIEVKDGDTLKVFMDNGTDNFTKVNLRLNGLNAREHDMEGGPEAAAYLTALVTAGPLELTSLGWDKYGGRIDALLRVEVKIGRRYAVVDVNAAMLAAGYAAPWNGKGEKPIPPWPPSSADRVLFTT